MKTWRQIDAMAKHRGALVDRGLHSASIYQLLGRETDVMLFSFESWLTPRENSIVLRAACEAALERLVTP